jgi:hypothetical protein
MPVAGAPAPLTFTVMVNDTTPLWFYCKQTNPAPHCGKGMVLAVNPTANSTFEAFQQAANATADASGAAPPAGGSPTDGGSGAASPTASGSGAVGLNAIGAMSFASLFAAVAGFIL